MASTPTGQRVSDEELADLASNDYICLDERHRRLVADLRAAREEIQRLRAQFDERLSVALDDFDLPGVMAERDALQGRIDAALTVLDAQWRWCYGRRLVSPNLVRAALRGSSD